MERKEAIEIVRKLYNESLFMKKDKEAMVTLIPELKESEDERIRKELIEFVKSRGGFKQEYIAWLEKQGENPTTLPKWKYKKDNVPLLRDSLILNKYGCVAKSLSGAIVSDVWVIDYDELAKLPKEESEKQVEQKPAWSEEDEAIYYGVIETEQYMLDVVNGVKEFSVGNISIKEECTRELNWLKSLKDRVQPQPKQEWSEEDEEHIMAIDLAVNRCTGKWHCCGEKCPISEHIPWLKSLRPQNWTKEDKERYISCLQRLSTGNPEQPETINSKWFKEHVYPQFTWKPSKKQMKWLHDAIESTQYEPRKQALISLYSDLMKLKD